MRESGAGRVWGAPEAQLAKQTLKRQRCQEAASPGALTCCSSSWPFPCRMMLPFSSSSFWVFSNSSFPWRGDTGWS